MDLKDQINFLLANKTKIILFGMLFGLLGIFSFYIFKPSFYTTGDILVLRRNSTTSNEYFTYEGFYSQQTSQNLTKTFGHSIKTESFLSEVAKVLNLEAGYLTLIKLKNMIITSYPAPNVISIKIKSKDMNEGLIIWENIKRELNEKQNQVNVEIDPELKILEMQEKPFQYSSFSSIWFNFSVMFIFGIISACAFYILKNYLNTNEK